MYTPNRLQSSEAHSAGAEETIASCTTGERMQGLNSPEQLASCCPMHWMQVADLHRALSGNECFKN